MNPSDDRIDRLEARIAALEASLSAPEKHQPSPDDTMAASTSIATEFWALDGLKSRLPDPGGVLYVGAVNTALGPVEWQYGLTTGAVLAGDWSEAAASLAALAHPARLSLLKAVIEGTDTVAALAELTDLGSTGQIYNHINQLVAQGWLATRSRGHYVVPPQKIVPLLTIITATGKATQ